MNKTLTPISQYESASMKQQNQPMIWNSRQNALSVTQGELGTGHRFMKFSWLMLAVMASAWTAFAAGTSRTWTGASSTDWNTAGNWAPSGTPGTSDSLTLTNGNSRYPVISTGTANGSTVAMGASGTGAAANISITGGTLAIGGNITLSG